MGKNSLYCFAVLDSLLVLSHKKILPDYNFTALLKFYKNDYQGAISDWEKILETNKNAPDILENIRRAEQKLKEQN